MAIANKLAAPKLDASCNSNFFTPDVVTFAILFKEVGFSFR